MTKREEALKEISKKIPTLITLNLSQAVILTTVFDWAYDAGIIEGKILCRKKTGPKPKKRKYTRRAKKNDNN